MKLNVIIALVLVSLTLMYCKKYNEGPRVSFRSKKERLANEWILSERYVADTVNMWDDSLNTGLLTLGKTGLYSLVTDTLVESGQWVFNHDKKKVVLEIFDDTNVRPDLFQIQKLKEVELWWSYVDSSGISVEEHYVSK